MFGSLFAWKTEMKFIQWSEEYSVNVAEVDEQHRRLFDLINELHEAMADTRAQYTMATVVHEVETIGTVLNEMMDYVSYHFSMEENHMVAHGYPEYAVHYTAHRQFNAKVKAFMRGFDDGKAIFSAEIVEFIRDWWRRHILVVDKRLGVFLNEKGLA